MKQIVRIFSLLLLTVTPALVSCNKVHEFPEKGKEVDPTIVDMNLTVKCNVTLAGRHVVTKAAAPIDPSLETDAKYDRRYFLDIRSNEYVDTLVEHHTIIKPASDTSAITLKTALNARKYKIVVWMDYVLKGTQNDLYYSTDNGSHLNSIHIQDKASYVAGTDYKDIQTFTSELDLTKYADVWFADVSVDTTLTRPMAKITFLSDDLEKYAKEIGSTLPLEQLADGMKVTFSYTGYIPTGFNAISGKLNDAETGYSFNHKAIYPTTFDGNDYTLVGSDILFVNGESSSVTVTASITDSAGKLVNQINTITVPIYPNKETVVIYKFFTKEYVPGIGINPSFDGEFNIYV